MRLATSTPHTQGTNSDRSPSDIGWLSFSTDHGAHWSAPVQATPDQLNVPHIMEVAGGGNGIGEQVRRTAEFQSQPPRPEQGHTNHGAPEYNALTTQGRLSGVTVSSSSPCRKLVAVEGTVHGEQVGARRVPTRVEREDGGIVLGGYSREDLGRRCG